MTTTDFDRDAALKAPRDGKSRTHKNGVFRPSIEQLIEAVLQGERGSTRR